MGPSSDLQAIQPSALEYIAYAVLVDKTQPAEAHLNWNAACAYTIVEELIASGTIKGAHAVTHKVCIGTSASQWRP